MWVKLASSSCEKRLDACRLQSSLYTHRRVDVRQRVGERERWLATGCLRAAHASLHDAALVLITARRRRKINDFLRAALQNLLNTFEYIVITRGKRTSVISHCCFLLQLGPSIKTKTAGSSFIHSPSGNEIFAPPQSRNFDRCFWSLLVLIYTRRRD